MTTKLDPVSATVEEDKFIELVHEVENLGASEARTQVRELIEDSHGQEFRIGALLTRIEETGEFGGHESYEALITDLGIQYRKAKYLTKSYKTIVELGIPWTLVEPWGWTKLRILAPILTADNFEEILSGETKTCTELHEFVKGLKGGKSTKEAKSISTGMKTFSLPVHEDQHETIANAIEKAKELNDTKFAAVALDSICVDYLAGGSAPPEDTPPEEAPSEDAAAAAQAEFYNRLMHAPVEDVAPHFTQAGFERIAELLDKAFPDIVITAQLP